MNAYIHTHLCPPTYVSLYAYMYVCRKMHAYIVCIYKYAYM